VSETKARSSDPQQCLRNREVERDAGGPGESRQNQRRTVGSKGTRSDPNKTRVQVGPGSGEGRPGVLSHLRLRGSLQTLASRKAELAPRGSEWPIPERGNREVESDRGRNSFGRESTVGPDAKQVVVLSQDEVWEPGVGAEATGGLCPGLNRTGVACIPGRPSNDAGESETEAASSDSRPSRRNRKMEGDDGGSGEGRGNHRRNVRP